MLLLKCSWESDPRGDRASREASGGCFGARATAANGVSKVTDSERSELSVDSHHPLQDHSIGFAGAVFVCLSRKFYLSFYLFVI